MQQQGTWAELIKTSTQKLTEAGVPSAQQDALALAEKVRKMPAHAAYNRDIVAERERLEFGELIARRAQREPRQHIIGRMYFRYLELEAKPGVFIVRPETEMVAQAGIDALKSRLESMPAPSQELEPEPLIALELFSGSGAIALSLATEVAPPPKLRVYAVELSREAYESAQRNNARYASPVTFLHADALAPLPQPHEQELAGKVALLIANPPYVPPYHELSPEVQADPAAALYGGGELGLDIPLATIARARKLLAPGGTLIMEHACEQAQALRKAAKQAGFINAHTGKDLTGAERWLSAELP